jgi:hypothetical protein
LRQQGTISEATSKLAANWSKFRDLRDTMNATLFKVGANPNIEWHHLVQQAAKKFSPNAINSLANVVPLPQQVHKVISNFQSTQIIVAGTRYSSFTKYVTNLPWERQYEIGLNLVRQAMTSGVIDPSKVPL